MAVDVRVQPAWRVPMSDAAGVSVDDELAAPCKIL
jgi:hypothetical protein